MEKYHAANEVRQEDAQGARPVITWRPPAREQYKVNVNGAVFKHRKKTEIGVAIWDENGVVIAALSKIVNAPWEQRRSKQKQ